MGPRISRYQVGRGAEIISPQSKGELGMRYGDHI